MAFLWPGPWEKAADLELPCRHVFSSSVQQGSLGISKSHPQVPGLAWGSSPPDQSVLRRAPAEPWRAVSVTLPSGDVLSTAGLGLPEHS